MKLTQNAISHFVDLEARVNDVSDEDEDDDEEFGAPNMI
jgi:hypothetical protein